jgi:hypothetical protein
VAREVFVDVCRRLRNHRSAINTDEVRGHEGTQLADEELAIVHLRDPPALELGCSIARLPGHDPTLAPPSNRAGRRGHLRRYSHRPVFEVPCVRTDREALSTR